MEAQRKRKMCSPATIIATVAVFFSLAGSGIAAGLGGIAITCVFMDPWNGRNGKNAHPRT